MGAWIEIKFYLHRSCENNVAPLVGAWIEISLKYGGNNYDWVAPLVGAWIEIEMSVHCSEWPRSLPLWERGLKSEEAKIVRIIFGRSPCGSVD